jgi:hypothetical protein
VQFDATSANTLPAGWKRDFLLYTDGWIKDSDLNTAFGNTVGPLPFHRMKEYPYAPGDSYPTDAEPPAVLMRVQYAHPATALTRPSAAPRSRNRQEAVQPAVAVEHLHGRARGSRSSG